MLREDQPDSAVDLRLFSYENSTYRRHGPMSRRTRRGAWGWILELPAARPSSARRAGAWAAPAPQRLAEAGCEVVINGLDKDRLAATAAELRKETGAKIIAVAADVASPEGQKALFAACPEPDILVNNNAGPPFRDFRDLDRQKMIDGVIGNMIVAVELTQKAIDPMVAKKFGRIVNITSGSVKMPLFGLDLSSGARAGLTAFLAGVARSVAAVQRHHQFHAAGNLRHRPLPLQRRVDGEETRHQLRRGFGAEHRFGSGAPLGTADEFGATCAFLCSAQAGYITGQNLLIDGGRFPGAF